MSTKPHTQEHNARRGQTPFWLGCYQIFLILFGFWYLVLRLIRGKEIPGLRERLAWYSGSAKKSLAGLRRPIWIHLVSVGEVLAAEPFIREFRRRFPEKQWVITTVTPTGRTLAQRLIRGSQGRLLYLPWDLSPVVSRALRAIRPSFFISFETELWPVLFQRLNRSNVPIVIVNGRISPRAYRRYLWIRPFMERTLGLVTFFFTQSPQDARRYAGIGAPKDRIAVTGNVKWDLPVSGNGQTLPENSFRSLAGLPTGHLLWTAGSTHPGEELLVLQAYQQVKSKIPGIRLLIAPRHPERCAEVEQTVKSVGLSSIRRSALGNGAENDSVIVLDTLGELISVYQASDLVFVGGSLVPHGGHNLIEPAAFSRPILTGPHLNNFQAVAEALAQANGMVVVRSTEELGSALLRLAADPISRADLGRRAFNVIQEHRGATLRTVERVLQIAQRAGVFTS